MAYKQQSLYPALATAQLFETSKASCYNLGQNMVHKMKHNSVSSYTHLPANGLSNKF